MLYFIYELIDPTTNIPSYVGITNNPNLRLQQHLDAKEKINNPKKKEWIQRLVLQGLEPKMKILEIVDHKQQAQEREKHWIEQYTAQNNQLVNKRLLPKSKIKGEKPKKPKLQIEITSVVSQRKKPSKPKIYSLYPRINRYTPVKPDENRWEKYMQEYSHLIDFYGKDCERKQFEKYGYDVNFWQACIEGKQYEYESQIGEKQHATTN